MTRNTVKTHLTHISSKLHVSNRTELATPASTGGDPGTSNGGDELAQVQLWT